MNWFNNITHKAKETLTNVFADPRKDAVAGGIRSTKPEDDGLFKAYIPNFLYKPPYGMPRRVNLQQLKELSKNPYIFSVIKTLCDEATSIDWEIKVKKEFQKDGQNYEEKIKEVSKFFYDPNGNDQSFSHILRQVITDLLELDSGVIVKVFNRAGEFKQIFARDGSTFLMNPDIYGYMGNRQDFVPPLPDGFTGINIDLGGTPTESQAQMMKNYDIVYRQNAGYFQYGWTAGSMPVPFGKREIIYFMANPRGDSIYGRSPIEILTEVILNLVYGVDFNLDFYTNNNMADGSISLLGANTEQIDAWRENYENQFKFTDSLGNKRKRFFNVPISSTEVKFTPFQLSAKEMEVISQQQWFTKILWMCFGVNADEMGYTESSNRAVGESQISTFKRKAIKPLLNIIQYHLNTQLIPEFFAKVGQELPSASDVPLEFCFDTYDIDEDVKKHTLLEQEISMGIKTPEMVAAELGINVEELLKNKAESEALENENPTEDSNDDDNDTSKDKKEIKEDKTISKKESDMDSDKKVEKKSLDTVDGSKAPDNPLKEIENYIDDVGKALENAIDNIGENEL